jgi:2-C-methyl-D-erythritol 4-phosphate cytidylyltransferase / 2-C-methyl-D-erythritol 2,4-cyclodiphosphate synthase
MSRVPIFSAIIVAAGKGERAGLTQPKQFALLSGRSMVRWSVEAFARHPACAEIIVVTQDEAAMRVALANLSVTYAPGGDTRQQSVANGLSLVAQGTSLVMVHDAARPGLSAAIIDRLLTALGDDGVNGAIPALPVADTIARGDTELGDTVPRDGLWRVQTPQAFRADSLRAAHSAGDISNVTDDAQLVRAHGGRVLMVDGDPALDKVTQPGDLERMARQLGPQHMTAITRTGMGFDVHRLVPGDGVWLGGVLIPHDRKLLGHSDADVALHAITDAILGAIAAGDIGDHFPPSDPQWAGARSDQFLAHAASLAAEQGYQLTHIDCTIICEAPRIGPHRMAIRENIARILALPLDAISLKATTTEQLGFTGRGEGITAQAIATLSSIS